MTVNKSIVLSAGFLAGAAAIGLWAYLRLPPDAAVRVHVAANGRLDGALPKALGLALFPMIGAAVVLLLTLLPRIAPDHRGLDASAGALSAITAATAAVFLVAEGAIVASTFDPNFQAMRFVFVAVGVLFVLTGNLLGKIRHNAVLGIRTPWTVAHPRVWDKTHRFTGRLMFLAGLVLAASAVVTSDARVLSAFMVITAVTPAFCGVLYAWAIRGQTNQT